jgi:lipopolysaccharide heptosyltransferase III
MMGQTGEWMTERILVFRRGSLGDGIVSLPALHAIAATHPGAEFRALTNSPVSEKAAPLQDFLAGTGLIDGFFVFPPGSRDFATWAQLRRRIRAWRPDRLVYLSEPLRAIGLIREFAFFRACGIPRITGFPWSGGLRQYRRRDDRLWESETSRLLRAVGADAVPADGWDAGFTEMERTTADAVLADWPGKDRFIAFSVGGKGDDKDWGDDNWRQVLSTLAAPDLGLMLIGAENERERSQALAADWPGPVLDLCGRIGPRIAAMAIKGARIFLGHDSGPMHLAALVGVRCVAIFAARAKPGVWFPHGDGHRVFYPWDLAETVSGRVGLQDGGTSIRTIQPTSVIDACRECLVG